MPPIRSVNEGSGSQSSGHIRNNNTDAFQETSSTRSDSSVQSQRPSSVRNPSMAGSSGTLPDMLRRQQYAERILAEISPAPENEVCSTQCDYLIQQELSHRRSAFNVLATMPIRLQSQDQCHDLLETLTNRNLNGEITFKKLKQYADALSLIVEYLPPSEQDCPDRTRSEHETSSPARQDMAEPDHSQHRSALAQQLAADGSPPRADTLTMNMARYALQHEVSTVEQVAAQERIVHPEDLANLRAHARRIAADGGPRASLVALSNARSRIQFRNGTFEQVAAEERITHPDDLAVLRAEANRLPANNRQRSRLIRAFVERARQRLSTRDVARQSDVE